MFKTQDRVFMKFTPTSRGTVTKVANGKFSVTWDSNGAAGLGRKRGEPRQRYTYDERALASIKLLVKGSPEDGTK